MRLLLTHRERRSADRDVRRGRTVQTRLRPDRAEGSLRRCLAHPDRTAIGGHRVAVQWRKSSVSGGVNDEACVEVASLTQETTGEVGR
ncbi:DUF397 domain-containing protein [Actinoallomurus liliacearum]|uniref:DUF397 domain-containing protein n=1 Tax=Actinoallomurus liliacearum TaxID=1080073 RepID=UPI003CD09640